MRRICPRWPLRVFLALLLCASILGSVPRAFAERGHDPPEALSSFPKSLQYIDAEAFAGTALSAVAFDTQLQYIGSLAFYGAQGLESAYIPESAQYIAPDAFLESGLRSLHGIGGSYAQSWAEEQEIAFVEDDIWDKRAASPLIRVVETLVLLSFVALPADLKLLYIRNRILEYVMSRRPQDRTDLYPIEYRFP